MYQQRRSIHMKRYWSLTGEYFRMNAAVAWQQSKSVLHQHGSWNQLWISN